MQLTEYEWKLRAIVRDGDSTRADPRAQLKAAFSLITCCLEGEDYQLTPGCWEHSASSEALAIILLNIQFLNNIFMRREWAEALGTKELKQLKFFQFRLSKAVSDLDFIGAMDFAQATATKMLREFRRAKYYEPSREEDSLEEKTEREYERYKVAVVLPLIVSQMKAFWLPVRREMIARCS